MFKFLLVFCVFFSVSLCLAEENNVMVFSASWCGPCQQMKQDVWASQEIKKYKADNPHVKFIEVDIDKDRATMNKHKVRAVPTILINKRDVEKNIWIEKSRKVGYTNKRALLRWFKDIIGE